MFEKEIRELFELCLRAQHETNAYVVFTVSSTHADVTIYDAGFSENKRPDGVYFLHVSDDPVLKAYTMYRYRQAVVHLETLIKDGAVGA